MAESQEDLALTQIIEKVKNLKTSSEAFLTKKLLNSANGRSLPKYLDNFYAPLIII